MDGTGLKGTHGCHWLVGSGILQVERKKDARKIKKLNSWNLFGFPSLYVMLQAMEKHFDVFAFGGCPPARNTKNGQKTPRSRSCLSDSSNQRAGQRHIRVEKE